MTVYRCICGYVYDDRKEDVRFEDLPDDWRCPYCNSVKAEFTPMDPDDEDFF